MRSKFSFIILVVTSMLLSSLQIGASPNMVQPDSELVVEKRPLSTPQTTAQPPPHLIVSTDQNNAQTQKVIDTNLLDFSTPMPPMKVTPVASPHNREYTSKPLGFIVSLPNDWTVNEYINVGFGFSFLSPKLQFDDNGVLHRGSYITVRKFDFGSAPNALEDALGRKVATFIGEFPAIKYVPISQEENAKVSVDIYHDRYLYRFTLHYDVQGDDIAKEQAKIFESILASLEFIEPVGKLPMKAVKENFRALSYDPLAFPFPAGNEWEIASGYQNGNQHEGYALYSNLSI
ncbi:MAG: hypothetical protein H6668_03060 [Ardenticatenaceae bacterium]|nr:hypothetical protein [Ardenticatenaceae bacterium]